jgi:hypothetical protein
MIEDFKAGDLVLTPMGIRKVTGCGFTGYSGVIEKFGLRATPKHKVFTYEKGLDRIVDARYNASISKLTIMEVLKWKYKKLLSLMVSNTG